MKLSIVTNEMIKKIISYAAVKSLPSFIGLAIVPFLFHSIGAERYGAFSLYQSYAFLFITFFSSISTQPLYRFYTGQDIGNRRCFLSLLNFLSFVGFIICFIFMLFTTNDYSISGLTATTVSLGIIYSNYIVINQIESGVKVVAKREIIRVVTYFIVSVLIVLFFNNKYIALLLLIALGGSFLCGIIFDIERPIFLISLPKRKWLFEKLFYGIKSSLWLLCAGIPWLLGKTLIAEFGSSGTLGVYSYFTDLAYKALSVLSASFVMAIFPNLVSTYELFGYQEAKKIINKAKFLYGVSVIGMFGIWLFLSKCVTFMPNSLIITYENVLIFGGCATWQAGSIFHKTLELTKKTEFMLLNIVLALILFLLVFCFFLNINFLAYTAVSIALFLSGVSYLVLSVFCEKMLRLRVTINA